MGAPPTVVEVNDLHKTFRPEVFGKPVTALRGVSFSVREGECFGYLGQNGAGKTTTLKVLTGLMTPTKGTASLLGKPSGDAHARRDLGYLPENPYFYEHLTPVEALEFYGRLSGVSPADVRARTPRLLERVQIQDVADRRIRGFSKGMRQRLGLAAALVAEPPLLLLDEPLSGLDPHGRHLVKEIVLEERKAGRTVFMCSHVLSDVEELCDRVVVLHGGVVVKDGAIHDLLDSEPKSFELTADRVPAELRARIQAASTHYRESGDKITAHVRGSILGPEFAAAVQGAGGRVLSLVPERETLETWFVRVTGTAGSARMGSDS
ncbi:MAG: ABC transporter ATP-binding protein [Planctomycetes bacterium]|nr:ABC transporter ATP-binding protein [Planctomycetota bacterium]